jgi:potassium-transporting ATPase KdpC subunit
MKILANELRTALVALMILGLILGLAYPLTVWGVAQALFSFQADGSLLVQKGKVMGSALLAQNFTDPRYFHPRPSAAGDNGYDGLNSGGSNLGPTSKKLLETVQQRVADYRTENNLPPGVKVPADAVTASASGLDPHISLENALLQVPRVAAARGIGKQSILNQIELHTEGRDLGVFGESRINVLMLNLSLDKIAR